MLKRQRILLAFLSLLERKCESTDLMSWLSHLSTQPELTNGETFYDFIHATNIPISFTAEHEIGKLVEKGYIDGNGYIPSGPGADPTLLSELKESTQTSIRRAVYHIKHNKISNGINTGAVLESSRTANGSSENHTLYTAGYEGHSLESFLSLLLKNRIECIIDVRRNPISRKYGFSKGSLSNAANRIGLAYRHQPEFGIDSSSRRDLQTKADYCELILEYSKTKLPYMPTEIKNTSNIACNQKCVLVCYEADIDTCHRNPLSYAIANECKADVEHL